ncbi:phosphodiesterase [Bordetella sp. LUAb4]|uniref:phosphodiesterase n=1 Tax=Bordetella sp. LUAb4 TaxID=2843195 RepID=UPI00351CBC07
MPPVPPPALIGQPPGASTQSTPSAHADRPVLLIHLSDAHLGANSALMLGVDTDASLRAVVDQIHREHGDADLVLATGDLSQDGSEPAYRRFARVVGELGLPVRCLPGNHDAPAVLARTLGNWAKPVTDVGAWRVIALNSTVAGSNAGHLDRQQLELLDTAAADAGPRPVLVALHHNAVPMTPDWHDTMMLDNATELFRHLGRWRNIRVLLWGHVHQEFDRRRGNMRLLATPSTCFQFTIRDGRHRMNHSAPGYRWLKLYPDGSLATGVRRLDALAWEAMLQGWAQLEADQAA